MQWRARWAHRLAPLTPALVVAALHRGPGWDLEAILFLVGVAVAGYLAHAAVGVPLLRWLRRRGNLTLGWTLLGGAVIGALVWLGLIVAFVASVDGSDVTKLLAQRGVAIAATGAVAGGLAALVFALIAGLPLRRDEHSGAG